jgi:hypothetical protein
MPNKNRKNSKPTKAERKARELTRRKQRATKCETNADALPPTVVRVVLPDKEYNERPVKINDARYAYIAVLMEERSRCALYCRGHPLSSTRGIDGFHEDVYARCLVRIHQIDQKIESLGKKIVEGYYREV